MLSRRALLISSAATVPALMLGGCATGGTTTNTAWIAALQAIGTELQTILPQLESAGLPATDVAQAVAIINDILAVLSGVSTGISTTTGQSILVQVETLLNQLAPIIAPFLSLIPGVGSVVGLIVAALPAIEFAVNLIISLISPQLAALASYAPAIPAAARLRRAGASSLQISQIYMDLLIARANTKHKLRRHR